MSESDLRGLFSSKSSEESHQHLHIYIVHGKEPALASSIKSNLEDLGYTAEISNPQIGHLSDAKHQAQQPNDSSKRKDVVVLLLTEKAFEFPPFHNEVAAAVAVFRLSKDTLVIPLAIDSFHFPYDIVAGLPRMVSVDKNIGEIARTIDFEILRFFAQRNIEKQEKAETQERIEKNVADFIDSATKPLKAREESDSKAGKVWYGLGFGSLLIGGTVAAYGLVQASKSPPAEAINAGWSQWVFLGFSSFHHLIVIGLLLAASKYAFMLGKSFMDESRKSADRVHAISFGEFYLRAYGDKAEPSEIREVFQHWNINNPSSFAGLNAGEYDPKFTEAIVEVARAVAKQDAKPEIKG